MLPLSPVLRPLWLVAVALALGASPAAQDARPDTTDLPPQTEPYEVAVLRSITRIEAPAFVVPMRIVNDTAYPVFVGAAPALWAGTLAAGADADPALRLTAAEALSLGLTLATKSLVQRPRPFVALDDIAARDRRYMGDEVFDSFSFPSGHTSSAFVIATSLSLSYPRWYVIVPLAAWASAMGLARVWHGVHYPSDVLAGAAVGVVSGLAVHVLLPDVFGDDEGDGIVVPFQIVIPL